MAPRQHGTGMRAVAALLPGITRRAFVRRGFAERAVLTDWPDIVGPALARQTMPERLVFPRGGRTGATLHVRVGGAMATELQHLEPLVVERINRHFGYAAVARLALRQGVVTAPENRRRPDPAPLAPAQERYIERSVAAVGDETLREALRGLGSAILASRERSEG